MATCRRKRDRPVHVAARGPGRHVPCITHQPAAAPIMASPGAVAAFAYALAYGGGLWLQAIHALEGAAERNEPAPLVHWLRDSSLALPLTMAAVWVATHAAGRLLTRAGPGVAPDTASRRASIALVVMVAYLASAAMALASPIHTALFDARHGGPGLPVWLHVARDGLLGLAANLPITAAVFASLRRRGPHPWPSGQA